MKHRCKNLLFLSVPKNTVSRAAFRQVQWPAEPFGLRCVRSLSGVRGAKAFGFVIAFLLLQNDLHAQTDQLAWEAVQTRVSFVIENAGLEVNGKFSQVTGQFVTDAAGKQPVLVTGSAQVKASIRALVCATGTYKAKTTFLPVSTLSCACNCWALKATKPVLLL